MIGTEASKEERKAQNTTKSLYPEERKIYKWQKRQKKQYPKLPLPGRLVILLVGPVRPPTPPLRAACGAVPQRGPLAAAPVKPPLPRQRTRRIAVVGDAAAPTPGRLRRMGSSGPTATSRVVGLEGVVAALLGVEGPTAASRVAGAVWLPTDSLSGESGHSRTRAPRVVYRLAAPVPPPPARTQGVGGGWPGKPRRIVCRRRPTPASSCRPFSALTGNLQARWLIDFQIFDVNLANRSPLSGSTSSYTTGNKSLLMWNGP